MKILVTNFHPTGGGGHVTYIRALVEATKYSNIVLAVAAPETSEIYQYLFECSYPHLYACNFPAKIQKEPLDILINIKKFRQIVSNFKPDIVHVNGAADLFHALWSHPFHTPYKIIRTHHAIRSISDDFYHNWIYQKKISCNIYVSQSAMQLSTQNACVPANIKIIENGVDLIDFQPITKNIELSKRLGIDENTICFGSCAGTAAYKRVDIMIDSALQLKSKTEQKFKILVLGEQNSGQALQKQAFSKGLHEFIYCGHHQDIKPYISLFDVGFVLSDSIETISFAAREMMAMGKPLISSSFSGLKENVQHGINGFLVNPGSSNDVALFMENFIYMSKKSLNEMSVNARYFAMENFNITKQQTSHVALYESLML